MSISPRKVDSHPTHDRAGRSEGIQTGRQPGPEGAAFRRNRIVSPDMNPSLTGWIIAELCQVGTSSLQREAIRQFAKTNSTKRRYILQLEDFGHAEKLHSWLIARMERAKGYRLDLPFKQSFNSDWSDSDANAADSPIAPRIDVNFSTEG